MRLFGFRDGKILIQAQITKINYRLLPNSSMMIGSALRSCKNIPLELRDFSMDITVKTKHGGIITIEKMLDGELEQ